MYQLPKSMAMISLSGFEGGETSDPVRMAVSDILQRTKLILTGWFRSCTWNLSTPYLNIGQRSVYWRGREPRTRSDRGLPCSVGYMNLRWWLQFRNQGSWCYEKYWLWLSTSRYGTRLQL